jgi:undecaprenyl diphosphate synthase
MALNTHLSKNGIDPDRMPRHIAMIMDGNGRWATRQGLMRIEGHRQGYLTLKNIVSSAADLNIEVLSAYGFSSENWRRPKLEVTALMNLIRYAARVELEEMKQNGVRIIVSGRLHEIPAAVRKQLLKDVEETKDNTGITLNLAINYGGRNEIVDAAKAAAQMAIDGSIKPEDIDEQMLSGLMYHPELPDPDIMVRTAGELRTSNFLMWETAYTEMFVTETLWPDFSKEELVKSILDYQKRTRKFGKVVNE